MSGRSRRRRRRGGAARSCLQPAPLASGERRRGGGGTITVVPGPVALVGSGEYLPVLEPLERRLLDGRPPRYVQLATAAAPEGPASVGRWHALGRAAAERLGVQQVVVPVVDRV